MVTIEDRGFQQDVIRVETKFRFPWRWVFLYFGLGCITIALWPGPMDKTIYVGTISLEGLIATLLIGLAMPIARSVTLFRRQIWSTIDPTRLSKDFDGPLFIPSLYSGPILIVLLSLLALGLSAILPPILLPIILVWTLLSTILLLVTSSVPFILADWATHFSAGYWLLREAHDGLPHCAFCNGKPNVAWPSPPTIVRDMDGSIEIHWEDRGPDSLPDMTQEEWLEQFAQAARDMGFLSARMAAEEFGVEIREIRRILGKWWKDERELDAQPGKSPTYSHGKWWAPRGWWQEKLQRERRDS